MLPSAYSAVAVSRLAANIYKSAGLRRWIQRGRPYICPFEPIAEHIPTGASVLDVGCGAGLLLISLAAGRRLSRGCGVDADEGAIETAKSAYAAARAEREVPNSPVEFAVARRADQWPTDLFDVVTVVDVMHHVAPAEQRKFIEAVVARVKPGGLLVYKDMAERPFWRASANRIHDLLMTAQWIHYAPMNSVVMWVHELGMTTVARQAYSRLVYGHELLVSRRRPA